MVRCRKTDFYNTSHNDSSKAIFGDGSDLKIYSNGTDGYVEASVDDLVLQAADDVFIYAQGGEDGIKVIGNGAVELYYDNSKKFQTTSTGISVTGSVTATNSGTAGIFNSGTTNVVASFTSTDGTGVIQLADSSGNVEIGAAGNNFVVQPAGGVAQLTVGASSSTFAGDLDC